MFNLKRLIVVAAMFVAVVPLRAAIEVKLATQAPPGTSWANALLDLADSWKKDTADRVTLKVFPGGVLGSEKTVLQRMRPGVDTVQATFITSGGLADIDPAFNVFGIPFFFENDAEQLAVQKALTPKLAEKLKAKGYQFVCWGTGGWIQIFSKKPIKSLKELKDAKLYASRDDEKMTQWYVSNGFHPVQLVIADIVPQMKLPTGLIDTAPYPPYLANMTNVYRDAKYMLDLHIAPLTGALIMSTQAWNKISPEDQQKLTASAVALEGKIRTDAPGLDARSITTMKERGLEVISVDAKTMTTFRDEATKLAATMRGNMVPADIYDLAVTERDAARKAKGK